MKKGQAIAVTSCVILAVGLRSGTVNGDTIVMDRIAMLKEVLTADGNNVLARYGLAMEYSKTGATDDALTEFNALIVANPGYVAAYQQAAQTLVNAERFDEAKSMLQRGMAAADLAKNPHARSEMEMMLEEISR